MPDIAKDPKGVILVVEDNPSHAAIMEEFLRSGGHRVTIAGNSTEAIEAVERETPDLIILDIMLEEDSRTSGFELCRRFKSDERTSSVPVLMVTALNELQHIEEGVEVGTDDFLTKPIQRLEVLARVRSLLKVRHLQSELARTLAYLNELEK